MVTSRDRVVRSEAMIRRSPRCAARSTSTTATPRATRRWMRSMRASCGRAISPSTSAATSATASAASAGSARAWSRWSRSRCAREAIRTIYAGDKDVTLVEAACGARAGHAARCGSTPPIRPSPPHRATFVAAADGAGGWEGQVWDAHGRGARAPRSMRLIASNGAPAFAKIDVEGFEDACSPACRSRCRRFPSNSPRSSATSR